MTFKNGATVRQIVAAPMEGVVTERRFNDSADQMEYLVVGANADRWFLESAVVHVADPEPEVQTITAGDVGNAADVLGAT